MASLGMCRVGFGRAAGRRWDVPAGVVGAGQQVRGMANLKAVRNRMKSVSSIQKITKAMSMVAAAKLRTVQVLQANSAPFASAMTRFFNGLETALEKEGTSADGKSIMVAMTSDRGLCGGVNSSIVKKVKEIVSKAESEEGVEVVLVGDKGRDGVVRAHGKLVSLSFKDVFKSPVPFTLASLIAEDIAGRSSDSVSILYNKYINPVEQKVSAQPVVSVGFMKDHAEILDEYEFDTDIDSAQVLLDLFEFQLASQIFNSCMQNATSEQAARMSAMDNATRNAGEMLDKLTLTYNRQRQAVITSELIEIISGAEALNG